MKSYVVLDLDTREAFGTLFSYKDAVSYAGEIQKIFPKKCIRIETYK